METGQKDEQTTGENPGKGEEAGKGKREESKERVISQRKEGAQSHATSAREQKNMVQFLWNHFLKEI